MILRLMKKMPITTAMLKHHQIINKNLLDCEKVSEKDSYKFNQLFNIFKWNIRKHMFIEEENIFPIADRTNKNEINQLNNLLKDHKDIRGIIESLDEELRNGIKPNTAILRELLYSHEGRETDSFYPLLDNRLPEQKKKEIIRKLKDVKLV